MVEKANHCVYEIKYHLVLCVKYRKKLLLTKEVTQYLTELFRGLEERYSIKFETIGFDKDHCHVLVRAKPRYPPSNVMRLVKNTTARMLFKQFDWIKKELWGGEFWSDGGYIGTVGEGVNAEIIRKYIEKQGDSYDKSQMTLMEFLLQDAPGS
jgi:putative transposase